MPCQDTTPLIASPAKFSQAPFIAKQIPYAHMILSVILMMMSMPA